LRGERTTYTATVAFSAQQKSEPGWARFRKYV